MDRIPVGTLCLYRSKTERVLKECTVVGYLPTPRWLTTMYGAKEYVSENCHLIDLGFRSGRTDGFWGSSRNRLIPITPDETIRDEEREMELI